ncbi:MAG: M1 family aminopeptidase, partial [Desulfobacterales bacterium]
LPKLDLIAIPDFAFGAMENWGAITFRENLLLHYPGVTSVAAEERICEVIAHEIAHQWFGNLVTPSDWKYLWLNESFATFLGFGILDHYYPEWRAWDHFSNTQTHTALERDALHETFPIEIPGGEHVVINTGTAPIIYSKGGSILRQIEGYIGKDNFQKGLRHYLKTHEYGCASSHHFWEAFETVTEEPITRMMKSWVGQPGFPVIQVDRIGSNLILNQKRFTYLPNDSEQQWMIPVNITVIDNAGGSSTVKVLLEGSDVKVDIGDDVLAYKINSGQTGFYRVHYLDADNLAILGKRIADKTLPEQDRWGLQDDLFALVRSGDVSMAQYLDFLSYYENEDAYLPLVSIAGNLGHAQRVFRNPVKDKVASFGRALFERVLSDMGYTPVEHEPHTTSSLRDQLIWQAVVFGSEPATEFARDQFGVLTDGGSIDANIVKSVMQTGAHTGNRETFDWFVRRLETADSEHDRLNVLSAMGCFQDPALIDKSRAYALEHVPDRNKSIPIVALAVNPISAKSMWDWYVEHLDALEGCHPIIHERIIAGIVPLCGIAQSETVRAFFNEYLKEKPWTKDVVRLSLEKLEINVLMRAG